MWGKNPKRYNVIPLVGDNGAAGVIEVGSVARERGSIYEVAKIFISDF